MCGQLGLTASLHQYIVHYSHRCTALMHCPPYECRVHRVSQPYTIWAFPESASKM